jgi:hypothetical protein
MIIVHDENFTMGGGGVLLYLEQWRSRDFFKGGGSYFVGRYGGLQIPSSAAGRLFFFLNSRLQHFDRILQFFKTFILF